jgi:membrane protein
MRAAWQSLFRSAFRVFPGCVTQSQAIAFNMFLAFFPMLLLALGLLTSAAQFRAGVHEMVVRLRDVLPPSSRQLVVDFLVQHGMHPWRWIALGLGGTLLAGTQMMKLMMDGFQMAYRDSERHGFWSRQARALLLLTATFVPWLASVIFTVFGKQVRAWLIRHYGLPALFRGVWTILFSSAALVVAILVLAVVYHVGRPGTRGWREVLPGAVVATLIWGMANSVFGFYLRHAAHTLVYGGVAAAIGLMLWMQLTAIIVLFGAAFNAELAASESGD